MSDCLRPEPSRTVQNRPDAREFVTFSDYYSHFTETGTYSSEVDNLCKQREEI